MPLAPPFMGGEGRTQGTELMHQERIPLSRSFRHHVLVAGRVVGRSLPNCACRPSIKPRLHKFSRLSSPVLGLIKRWLDGWMDV